MIENLAAITPVFVLCCGIAYTLLHILLAVGVFRHREPSLKRRSAETVSVLLAARNEEDTIRDTLDALVRQSLSPDEIIVADDRSTDGTASIVQEFVDRDTRVRLIQITSLPEGYAPKKHALQCAIDASKGDLLCFTDADSLPPSGWLEGMVGCFDDRTGVVAGTHVPGPAQSSSSIAGTLLRSFVRYERLRATLLAVGSLEIGHPWMASGASFAYRRVVYDQVGGFSGHISSLSGDDDLFLQHVRTRTDWTIRASMTDATTVRTRSPLTVGEFIQQRRRHFSAGRSYAMATQFLLGIYHSCNIISLAAFMLWFIFPDPIYLGTYALKVSADVLLFAASERHISRSRDWVFFLPMEVLYVLYMLLIGPLGYAGRPSWKDGPPV